MQQTLTPRQQQIIELIAEGNARWAIAVKLEIAEQTVRNEIRTLCARFDCPMVDLPTAIGIKTIADDDDGEISFRG